MYGSVPYHIKFKIKRPKQKHGMRILEKGPYLAEHSFTTGRQRGERGRMNFRADVYSIAVLRICAHCLSRDSGVRINQG